MEIQKSVEEYLEKSDKNWTWEEIKKWDNISKAKNISKAIIR